ncbi:MAG: Non-canonical purine NTP pyrophosphatase [Candidatus Uhrbacteria bacterium GW2011_GWE2_40_58]|nr:MAG: Non-canonical purine NTP pyrophosphatase [Candidatus Uhrbacteria bacterium GW2011_GWF2_40_263]KKR67550.1 MAG: Non-canonical purine NTP pyrophosphatase [Candidatus Uhrbacteria bacterium GW2011_GWE2_40_58]
MKQLILATHNTGKLAELRQMLANLGIEVMSATEAGVTQEPEETGETFKANALMKAQEIAKACGHWCVADDSGICIEALGGRPGVYTARWAGEGASDEQLIAYTLEQMKEVPEGKRGAQFVCCAALVSPDGESWVFEGIVEGKLATESRGVSRAKLPYDSVFIPEGYHLTFAEMDEALKHTMSHRGRAFQKLKTFLVSEEVFPQHQS